MIYAIVSDIHANWQAWQAVLNDMQRYGPDSILCLGDIVGYGPMPAQVLESVCDNVDEIVIGNHDAVVCGRSDSENFNDNAKRVIDWTTNQLSDDAYDFFSGLASELDGDTFSMAHAELGDPERFDYVESEEMARETLAASDKPIVFIGHTHTSAIFVMDKEDDKVLCHPPSNFSLLPDMRYIVNVGSVGDPRSADLRAYYCIYDSDMQEVFFRHVPFDIDAYRDDMNSTNLPVPPFFMTVGENLEDYKPTRVGPAKRPIHIVRKKRTTIKRIDQPLLPWEDTSVSAQLERHIVQEQETRKNQLAAGLKAARENQRAALETLKNAHLAKKRQTVEEEKNRKQRTLEMKKKVGEKVLKTQEDLNAKKTAKTIARLEVKQLLEKKKQAGLKKMLESRQIQSGTKDKSRLGLGVARSKLVDSQTQPIEKLHVIEKTQVIDNDDIPKAAPAAKSIEKTPIIDKKDNPEPAKRKCSQTDKIDIPAEETTSTTLSDKQKRIKAIKDAAIAKEIQRKNSIIKIKAKNKATRAQARQAIEMRKKKALEQKKNEEQ